MGDREVKLLQLVSNLFLFAQLWHRSLKFLANEDTVKDYVDNLGYDTCHKTKGYDASPCQKDCRRLEKSDFAKKCSNDGGFFKCCIRLVRLKKCMICNVAV